MAHCKQTHSWHACNVWHLIALLVLIIILIRHESYSDFMRIITKLVIGIYFVTNCSLIRSGYSGNSTRMCEHVPLLAGSVPGCRQIAVHVFYRYIIPSAAVCTLYEVLTISPVATHWMCLKTIAGYLYASEHRSLTAHASMPTRPQYGMTPTACITYD